MKLISFFKNFIQKQHFFNKKKKKKRFIHGKGLFYKIYLIESGVPNIQTTSQNPVHIIEEKNKKPQSPEIKPSGLSFAGTFFTSGTLIAGKRKGLLLIYIVSMAIVFINYFRIKLLILLSYNIFLLEIGTILIVIYWIIFSAIKGNDWLYNSPRFMNHEIKMKIIDLFDDIGGFLFFIYLFLWLSPFFISIF